MSRERISREGLQPTDAVPFGPAYREAWLTAAGLFAIALVVRIVAAANVTYPVPEDTAYYVDAAANLVHGRGFVVDALWSYQTAPLVLPRPAFEVWLPLPSLLVALPMTIFGDGFRVAQSVPVLIGSLIPVLAWRLGADVAAELRLPPGRARTLAVGSGLIACVLPAAVVFSTLPDSTAPFAVLALAACLIMTRLAAAIAPERPSASGRDAGADSWRVGVFDRRLLGLGAVLGFAALCRSEAVWLGFAWMYVGWFGTRGAAFAHRAAFILVPAVVAGLLLLPWAVRDWLVFGQVLPGQALSNALSIRPTDIYAYTDPPTLTRYLAQGPGALLAMRVTGTVHDLLNVLILPALPTGLVGLVLFAVRPRTLAIRALRPLLVFSTLGFVSASLIFPVATTWGTFLHESLAIDVLLVVATAIGLDTLIAAIGRIRHWWRPVAWLGPAFGVAVAVPLLVVSLSSISGTARDAADRAERLPATLAAAGITDTSVPIISDHPIWLARATGIAAIALPDEPPEAIVRLARDFDASYVVLLGASDNGWPDYLADGSGATCLARVPLATTATDPAADASARASAKAPATGPAPLAQARVFRVVCP